MSTRSKVVHIFAGGRSRIPSSLRGSYFGFRLPRMSNRSCVTPLQSQDTRVGN